MRRPPGLGLDNSTREQDKGQDRAWGNETQQSPDPPWPGESIVTRPRLRYRRPDVCCVGVRRYSSSPGAEKREMEVPPCPARGAVSGAISRDLHAPRAVISRIAQRPLRGQRTSGPYRGSKFSDLLGFFSHVQHTLTSTQPIQVDGRQFSERWQGKRSRGA